MRVILAIGVALTVFSAVPGAAADGDINADVFYQDAKELLPKGIAALFDKRTKPLMAHLKAAGLAAKTENDAASKTGKPLYCMPEATKKKGVGAAGVVSMIGRIPQPQRKMMTLKQAWRSALVRDFPCN